MAHEFDRLLDASGGRSFTNDRRREQYTQAATRLIAERGVEGASFAVIAEDTGTSKGTIAYHFESRSNLLMAVVRAIYLSAGEAIEDAIRPAVPIDAIQNYIGRALYWTATHPTEVAALIALRTSAVKEIRDFCNEIDLAVHAQLENLIRSTQPYRVGNEPVLLARALRGAIDAFALAPAHDRSALIDEYNRTLRRLFVPEEDA